jgi:hypothetical protein
MKAFAAASILLTVALGCTANSQTSSPPGGMIEHIGPLAPSDKTTFSPLLEAPALTTAQKTAIFKSVALDKFRWGGAENVNVVIGEPVPTLELYPLPIEALGQAPMARQYRYTVLADQVLLVDPRTFRVVDVIRP